MIKKTYSYIFLLIITLFLSSCEEDFRITTDYQDQTVVYAFLQHSDPWDSKTDTNFVIVNKAFLGEKNIEEMAAISDSVNYPNYDDVKVTLQRIDKKDIHANPIGEPIFLDYMQHHKKPGLFATDNNIVFYTTEALMYYKNTSANPRPDDEKYYYKLTVKKPNKKEVFAVTEVLRGIIEKDPFTRPEGQRTIQMESSIPNKKYELHFKTNPSARMYQTTIRLYYYEKRTDGNVYLDYVDYVSNPIISSSKNSTTPEEIQVNISPKAFYVNLSKKLKNTTDVVWRILKTKKNSTRPESHTVFITISTQEAYVYNQVSQPSYGIVQQKPTYSNIVGGIGLFTSKWTHERKGFTVALETVNALSVSEETKDLKFKQNNFTTYENDRINYNTVIPRY